MACRVCQKTFTLPSDDEYDSDAKPHVCPTCGQSFSLKIQLKRHTLLHANGEPFTCINCSKDGETDGNEDSISYNLRLSKKGDYNCEICNQNFSSKRMLLRHTDDEHKFESSHFCDDCPEIFETAADLKKHVATEHKTKTAPKKRGPKPQSKDSSTAKSFSCPTCDKTFTYQASRDKHESKCGQSRETSKKTKKRSNDVDEPSSSKKSRKTYVEVHENSDNKHECNVCGKSFKRKSALDGHMIVHIKVDEESEIEEEDVSANEESVEDSIENDLSKIKRSFICIKCNFVCFSQTTLVKHVCRKDRLEEAADKTESSVKKKSSEVSKDKWFKCPECGEKYGSLHALKLHEGIHVTERARCDICDKTFRSQKKLKKHYKSHNVEADEDSDIEEVFDGRRGRKRSGHRSKDFECSLCGKRFAGERCLQKHIERHSDDGDEAVPRRRRRRGTKIIETLTCSFCDEEFVGTKSKYLKHMAIHLPEVCGICDERFVDRQGLREHCKVHVGTEEGKMFVECSQKALDAKLGLLPPEPKVEYIYLVLR